MKDSPILNLGAGQNAPHWMYNVDMIKFSCIDKVIDLNKRHWPLESDAFVRVLAHDILEHLDDIPAAMREIWRVSQHFALVEIKVPAFGHLNHYTDPTHRHGFGRLSFDYFDHTTDLWQRYGYVFIEDFRIVRVERHKGNYLFTMRVIKNGTMESFGKDQFWERIKDRLEGFFYG